MPRQLLRAFRRPTEVGEGAPPGVHRPWRRRGDDGRLDKKLGESESATGWIPVVGSVTKSTIKVLHKAWNQFQEELKKA